MKRIGKKTLAIIFLISFAALMLEISLIRVLSLAYSYNLAMLVVSISLFGMSAGAIFLYVKKFKNPLYFSCILFFITTLLGFFLSSFISFDPLIASYNYFYSLTLLIYYVLFSLPFFFFGLILAHVFREYQKESGKIYFSNLSGSALGSISALATITFFGEYTITIAALFGLISAFVISEYTLQKKLAICFSILILLPLPVNISVHKEIVSSLNVPGSDHLESRWNSFSRVDLVNSSYTRYAPGLSLDYGRELPEQLGILTDGSGMTALTEEGDYDFTEYLPSYVGYAVFNFSKGQPKVLLINPKGGPDIIAGIRNNATMSIVEYNPTIIEIADDYRYFSGSIYDRANLVYGHGRKHARNNDNYDIIIISLSGDVHGSGIYGISQDYDLTIEGLSDYYNALNQDGYLIITRWLSYPPKESLRLFYLAREITKDENIIMFRSWSTVTLVIAKNPDFENILNFAEKNKFDIIFMERNFTPNLHTRFDEPLYYNYIQEIISNREFHKDYIFDVSPVGDDRPFYFNFFKIEKMRELHIIMGKNWQPFNDPGFLLLLLFVQSFFLCFLFIFVPLLIKYKLPDSKILFFLFIGLSYMFVEINLIQNFVKLFGNITHSAAFVILVMLTSSGLGSYTSKKFKDKKIFFTIVSLIILFYFFIGDIISYILILDFYLSLVLSALIIIPLGFFMGMPFPLGISKEKKGNVPWAFAVNGAASVLGSIAALILAIFFGFSVVLAFAALFYVCAWLFFRA